MMNLLQGQSCKGVANTDGMISRLKEENADVLYTRLDGVGHNVWENAYTKELIEWLLSKTKKIIISH